MSPEDHAAAAADDDAVDLRSLEYAVPPPEALTCPICVCVYVDAMALPCGHAFCAACVAQLPTPRTCPTCRAPFEATSPAFVVRTLVDDLVAACPHGCGVIVPRAQIARHTTTVCANRRATCPLCAESVRGAELASHLESACPRRPSSTTCCCDAAAAVEARIAALEAENAALRDTLASLRASLAATAQRLDALEVSHPQLLDEQHRRLCADMDAFRAALVHDVHTESLQLRDEMASLRALCVALPGSIRSMLLRTAPGEPAARLSQPSSSSSSSKGTAASNASITVPTKL